ncbi:MAG: response regulator [Planctomycetota bacterium]|jgi:signal transduction histidine kinase
MADERKAHPILIVDDVEENLNLLENILEEEGTIHRADSGDAAIDVLKREDVHLVLSDQRMPGITGVDVLEAARRIRPDAVRMLITAYPDIEVAVEAINRGRVRRYIPKPFSPAELRAIVRQELQHYELVLSNRRLASDLQRMVRDLTEANERLTELDKMKDEFLANVSHELKTPLVSGLGYVDLLLEGDLGKVDARQKKALGIAQRNLGRLLGFIEDLLTLARARKRRAFRPAPFGLKGLVGECVESLKVRSRKKALRVSVSVSDALPPVYGEERAIHSVMTNLLTNAEKFTPARARITVRARRIAPDRCEVRVLDNGTGVPADRQEGGIEIFAAGSGRESRKLSGLGIGLMLCRELLARHGSELLLKPRRPGPGTEVRFELPLAPPPPRKGRRGK